MASIQGIYLALFGRPVDPAGLAFWNEKTSGGQDLAPVIGGLTSSQEYLSRFDGQSNEQIVTSIYNALFGRAPDAAGLVFFIDALKNGSIETIAIQILDGAQGQDAAVVKNKEAAANLFTASLDTPAEIAAYVGDKAAGQARALINNVTADPATIPTAGKIDLAIQTLGEETGGGSTGGGGGGGGGTQTNQAPDAPSLSASSIDEETPGAVVGRVTATDPDGNAVTFSIDDPRFEIASGELKLKAGQIIDFEATEDGKVALTLTASDGLLSTSTNVILSINDRPDPVKLSGTAVDGYIAGATVFADANENGVLDPGEASTTTDATGNFTLAGGSGPLVMRGGIDISTNTPFDGVLKAPVGSTVITPLTTLVQALVDAPVGQGGTPLTVAEAQTKVLTGLGLSATLDLATFDPIAAALSVDPAESAAGAAAITAAIQIQNTIVQASAVLEGAGASGAAADAAVTTALAQAIAAATGGSSISNPGTLQSIVTSAATSTSVNTQTCQDAASDVAAAIAASNDAAQAAANSATSPTALLTALAEVSIVAQGQAAGDALAQAGSTGQTTDVTNTLNAGAIAAAVDDLPPDAVGNVVGDSLPETKTGTAGPDLLEGKGGNDTLLGLGGKDILDGGTGNDSLSGGDGDDVLNGGAGADLLDGGAGVDVAWYRGDATAGGTAGVVVNLSNSSITVGSATVAGGTATDGFGATDTLISVEEAGGTAASDYFQGNDENNYFRGFEGNDIAYGGNGFDGFQPGSGNDTFYGGADNDEVSYSNWGGSTGVSIDLSTATSTSDGPKLIVTDPWGGTDTLYSVERLRGTNNADTLIGDSGANRIRGLGGDDTLDGGAGTADQVDYLRDVNAGGSGGVIVNLSNTAVTVGGITVAAGSARDGFGNTDTLSGFERVRGTDQSDALFGDGANNRLDAWAGNDQIDGGGGFDEVFIDLFDTIGGPLTNHVVNGEILIRAGGVDVLKIAQSNGVVTTTGLGPAAFYGVDTARNVEAVSISVSGTTGSFMQILTQAAGVDSNGNGFINGTVVSETLDADVLLPGFAGTFMTINAFAGDDLLRNGSANGALNGGSGNDTLDGGAGTADLAEYSFDANSPFGQAGVIVNLSASAVTFGSLTLDAGQARDGFGSIDTLIGIEQVRGTQQGDHFTGGDGNETFLPLSGNDTVVAGGGNDFIVASAGADTAFGGAGFDQIGFNFNGLGLNGPLTVDALSAGGPFILANSVRVLQLEQSNGSVVITGLNAASGFGTETLSGVEAVYVQTDNSNAVNVSAQLLISTGVNQGTSFINGSVFGETIDAAAVFPNLPANTGVSVNGFLGSDTLLGSINNDYLDGGRGNDSLSGREGNDYLVGDAGNDTIVGGDGNDTAGWALAAGTVGTLSIVDVSGVKFVKLTTGTGTSDLFSITVNGTQASVTDLRADSPFGTDTVEADVERLDFFIQVQSGQPTEVVSFDWL